jgi:hypothetical protein
MSTSHVAVEKYGLPIHIVAFTVLMVVSALAEVHYSLLSIFVIRPRTTTSKLSGAILAIKDLAV